MSGTSLKVTYSTLKKHLPFCCSMYVKKVTKLLAFIFEQPSYTEAGRGRNACKLVCLINLFTVFSLLSLFRETSIFF